MSLSKSLYNFFLNIHGLKIGQFISLGDSKDVFLIMDQDETYYYVYYINSWRLGFVLDRYTKRFLIEDSYILHYDVNTRTFSKEKKNSVSVVEWLKKLL